MTDARHYRHPRTAEPLTLAVEHAIGDEVLSGALIGGNDRFPILNGIPRFCNSENYTQNFGYQWTHFASTQLDSRGHWGNVSERRLFAETEWPRRMEGQRILEAGCGMGRFTELLAATGAEIFACDSSVAVESNRRNTGALGDINFAQADIHALPFERGFFDRILCVGVLQHCPSPRRAFEALVPLLKPGGEIVVDVYRLSWRCLLLGKYYLRPFTRRLRPEILHRFVKAHVGWVYPFTGSIQRLMGPWSRRLSPVLAIADYRGVYDAPAETLRVIAELDTFDMLSPMYDRPQTIGQVRRWFRDAKLTSVVVRLGHNGIEARGRHC